MLNKAKLITALTIGAVATFGGVLALTVHADTTSATNKSSETIYDDTKADSSVLKAASQFHIFTKGDATLSSHVDGNMAVGGTLNANGNFGTKAPESVVPTDYYYLNKVSGIQSSSFIFGCKTKVVFKDSSQFSTKNDNGQTIPYINDTKMDHLSPDDITVNPNFIDFNKEFSYLEGLQTQVSQHTDNKVTGSTIDLSKYTPDSNGDIVLNMSKDELQDSGSLNIVNHKSGTYVYINVDGAKSPLTLSKHITIDGKGNSERADYSDSFLLWNVYNTSSVKLGTEWLGSTLAPDASLTSSYNIDGTIIANSVNLSGETHRWDFQGTSPPVDPGDNGDKLVIKNYKDQTPPKPYYGSKTIEKVDGDTNKPLEGVEFSLYNEDDKVVARATTDKDGLAKFTHLKEGKYYVVETKALPGYVQDTSKHFFEIARP